eukprot:m.305025 g.305025  ORF g.305025 m.305025 type:complete len:207 (-) comp16446_c4_seq5:1660-2280(-)
MASFAARRSACKNPQDLWELWKSVKSSPKVVAFYGHSGGGKYCCFSNFYEHEGFMFTIPSSCAGSLPEQLQTIKDISFSEKAIMLCKAALFDDQNVFAQLLKATTPRQAKQLGRQVQGFDDAIWKQHVLEIARDVVTQKFEQVDGLKDVLLSTGDALICEATRNDKIWGIGLNSNDQGALVPKQWKGSNILGWALMEAREALREDE